MRRPRLLWFKMSCVTARGRWFAQEAPVVIYVLLDPRDGTVRYVGKTSLPVQERLAQHVARPPNGRVAAWFRELAGLGLSPGVEVLTSCSARTWQGREKYWISYFLKRAHLMNADPGGLCRRRGVYVGPRQLDPRRVRRRRVRAEARQGRWPRAARTGPAVSLPEMPVEKREEMIRLYGGRTRGIRG